MPAKNSQKQYLENGYYHLYNRGVEKRIIFLDNQDYSVFLLYLKQYLLPKNERSLQEKLANKDTSIAEKDKILKLIRLNNFSKELSLLAYCLIPNHFHFLVKQKDAWTIDSFMNSLATRYSMYFNRKYKRVGSLYQGVYKAVLVSSNEQLLHLSRYIHKQALQGEALQIASLSSYLDYLKKTRTEWIRSDEILSFFSKTNPTLSYEAFIKQTEDFDILKEIILDDDF